MARAGADVPGGEDRRAPRRAIRNAAGPTANCAPKDEMTLKSSLVKRGEAFF